MLVDFLDPCPTCDEGWLCALPHDPCTGPPKSRHTHQPCGPCPDCVGGLVVSEDDIEAVAMKLYDLKHDVIPHDYAEVARAAVTTLIQEWRNRE